MLPAHNYHNQRIMRPQEIRTPALKVKVLEPGRFGFDFLNAIKRCNH